jgi:nitrate/TMAO reductase-like tetraheme cytochrome c subunit
MALFEKQTIWIKENKVKAAIIGVAALAAFAWINLEILHFSSSPPFCKGLCHTMADEVDMWEISSHGKRGIDCVSCHFREGAINYLINKIVAMNDVKNTLTGDMGRAMDEEEEFDNPEHLKYITEEQWEEEKLMDDVVLPQYIHNPTKDHGAGPSNFADENGNWRIQMHRYGFLWRIVEENCRNCHSSRGNRGRHASKKVADFIVRNTLLTFTDKVERRRKGIAIPHAFHLDRGIACIDCHQEVVHGPKELKDENGAVLPRMEICFRCHNDRRAPRECTLCHVAQKRMNLGIEGIGVEHADSYMYPDNATCTDCHLEENDWKMKAQVCIDCHDDEEMGETLHEWQSETADALAKLEVQFNRLRAALADARDKGRDIVSAEELFEDAYWNYSMVADDGTRGAHNIEYAEALLNASQEKLKLVDDMLMAY